jgi:prolyl oligopeptidase
MIRNGILLAVCLALGFAAAAQAADAPPVAAVKPVVDDYFGAKVTDDYRWMEDRKAPEFVAWATAENAYARRTLDRIPGRDKLLARIAAHTSGGASVAGVKIGGARVFYLKRKPGDNAFKLYVRDHVDGPERVLVDPEAVPTKGPHYAIDYFEPSLEGDKVAYGISPGGSEDSVIHILDLSTGKEGAETIDRAESGSPSWLPGGKAFFYFRMVKLGPGALETDKYLNSRALLHRVGTDPEADTPLIGTGVAGSPAVTPVDMSVVAAQPGSPYVIVDVGHGADPDQTYYIAKAIDVLAGHPAWRKVADVSDQVSDAAVIGEHLYLLSHKNASRFQVLETSAAAPDLATARVVVPASQRVIQAIVPGKDALYLRDLDGGLGKVRRLDVASRKISEIKLPGEGAVSGPAVSRTGPAVLIGMQGWVRAPAIYSLSNGAVARTSIVPKWADDLSGFETREVMATAKDGTKIPLSIVFKKGLKRAEAHPIWLEGYGAYGYAYDPGLISRYLAFVEDGGVYAVAHVRGGGEFGEDWHLAGKIATKPNTWNDLIACAEYLVADHYGKPEALAIEGRSAGGITVGRALTARPDLFRVVFSGVGDNNTLRSENGTDGPANSLEYGSVKTEAGFKALLESDSTQHVKPGVAYPAVLLTAGMNDPRVAPWQPGKMAAHLQAASSSGRPVLMLVDFDAGHGMGSTKAQRDKEMADQMAFFYWQIGKPEYQPPTK